LRNSHGSLGCLSKSIALFLAPSVQFLDGKSGKENFIDGAVTIEIAHKILEHQKKLVPNGTIQETKSILGFYQQLGLGYEPSFSLILVCVCTFRTSLTWLRSYFARISVFPFQIVLRQLRLSVLNSFDPPFFRLLRFSGHKRFKLVSDSFYF
jgi:hypothetical protein